MNIGWDALIKESYQVATSKGWHDEDTDLDTYVSLIHSEVSEVLDAYRRVGNMHAYRNDGCGNWVRESAFVSAVPLEFAKPEGVPSELADVLIRVADMCGDCGLKPTKVPSGFSPQKVTSLVCALHDDISSLWDLGLAGPMVATTNYMLGVLVDRVVRFCRTKKIDIVNAIELKTAHNKTREHRHGGKFL